MQSFNLDFYTQYNQFFILDKNAPIDVTEEIWTTEAFRDKMGILAGQLSISTGCYGPVKGKLFLLSAGNLDNDYSNYDHVVEGSIEIKSGIIEIIPCMANEPELSLKVEPGFYRVRVYSSGLDTVIGDEGDDFYTVEIWKRDFSERRVLKSSQ